MSSAAEDQQSASPIRTLIRDGNFLCIWILGGLTGVVRWFQLLAFGVYTFEVTGSPLLVSTIPILWMLPLTLLGPVIGVVADQISRKALLASSITMIITVQVGMAFAANEGVLSYELLALASILSGLFWATDMPIRRRLLGDLSGGHVSAAMGLDSATGNATRMAGPLLGGVVLQMVGMFGIFALSGVIYSVCLVLMLIAHLPGRITPAAAPSFLRDLAGGVRFVIRDRPLRRILTITIIFNMWGFPFTSMIPIIGREYLGLSPFYVGVISSMEGLGAFVGAMLVATLAKPEFFFRIYLGGTILNLSTIGYLGLLTFVAGGPHHSFFSVSMALMITGIASACFAAMQGTLTYLAAPPEFRSRVLGVLTLCIGTGPIGFFNVGWMAEEFGVPAALAIISAEGLFALLVLWVWGESQDQVDTPRPGEKR
ncbi:MAG: MFS transporter [Alphaproteobacteria bacterium]|nr:MFS transporter [Alphaproteobacteria bacterium]